MSDLVFGGAPLAHPDLVFGGESVSEVVDPLLPGELRFTQSRVSTSDLIFGDTGETAAPSETYTFALTAAMPPMGAVLRLVELVRVSVSAELPPLGASLRVLPSMHVQLLAQLPAMGLSATSAVVYRTQTERPTVNQVEAPAQAASSIEAGVQNTQQHAQATVTGTQAGFSEAATVGLSTAMGFQDADRTHRVQGSPFQEAARLPALNTQAPAQDGLSDRRFAVTGKFQEGERHQAPRVAGRFQEGVRDRRPAVRAPWRDAAPRVRGVQGFGKYAIPRHVRNGRKFQDAMRPPAGTSPGPAVPPGPVVIRPELLFACPPLAAPHLVFGITQCDPDTLNPASLLYILPARFYMTAHTIFAQRLPDLADVPIFDATVAADAGSFCWTLSASGPASLFDLLSPVDGLPVQLRVTLDGIPFVFAVDALSRSQKFGQTGVSISGRSVTALIGAPYLRAVGRNNTEPRLAQQLALDALTSTGVGLDWGLVDWTVPAGAWSHQGTPLDAVQAITQAAGGYLQSHRSAATLLARHPYSQRAGDQPGAPWGWMTGPADVELAPDAIILEGTERRDGADLNAVYVSGTTQGVLAQVKRTGTAGDKLAAMVTDALITDAIAARQRGLAILGAAGKKYHVRLELPVLTGLNQPGVLDVGQLVQVNATTPWRGRVQSVSVSAKRPSIRQTITLERHLETL